jgi:hypothetical protein
MSTIAEIKAAIDLLSPQERCQLEAMLHPWGKTMIGILRWRLMLVRVAS